MTCDGWRWMVMRKKELNKKLKLPSCLVISHGHEEHLDS